MIEGTSQPLLVAVESASCEALLEYAAAEARRRRCGIHLVHVLSPVYGGAPEIERLTATVRELRREGEAVLSAAKARLEHLLQGDPVVLGTELAHGEVAPSLVHVARQACLLLVQHQGMGPEGDTDTALLSTTHAVAAHAPVPTVAVPDRWRPAVHLKGPVVGVAIGGLDSSPGVLCQALQEADRRGATLRVLHAWLPGSLDPADVPHLAVVECSRLGVELQRAVAELATGWPSVGVECVVRPGRPESVLVDQASGLDLLVLGRRRHRVPLNQQLGPVVRGVLRWAPVPVMVVDPTSAGRSPRPKEATSWTYARATG
jgi:nucleotide-binding universal stress UspA family protein